MSSSRLVCCLGIIAIVGGCASSESSPATGSTAHWEAQLKSESPEDRLKALEKLTILGTQAASALPAINEALQDHDTRVRLAAIEVIDRLILSGKGSIAPVAALLEDPEDEVRARAAAAIGWGDEKDQQQQYMEPLIKMLEDPSPAARLAAARAIQRVDATAKQPLPVLMQLLDDQDAAIRTEAAAGLVPFGAEAKEAVPVLVKIIAEEDHLAREQAALAIVAIGPDAALAARDTLIEIVDSCLNPSECLAVGQALALVGADAKEAVPALRQMIGRFPRVQTFGEEMNKICDQIESAQ